LEKAAEWFDKAIELSPKAFWYVYYRGELAFQQKDYVLAREKINACLSAAKAGAADYGYIGKCQLMLEQLEGK